MPDLYDWIGALICLVGVSVMLWAPRTLIDGTTILCPFRTGEDSSAFSIVEN